MYLIVAFDLNSDIVDVPEWVIKNRDSVRNKFLNWIYYSQNKKNNKKRDGSQVNYVCYNSEEFINWLNTKLRPNEEAFVVEKNVDDDAWPNTPMIFF